MLLKNIGTAALDDVDLDALTRTRTTMSGIYNSARICPYNNRNCNPQTDEGMSLDPDIEGRLATLASTGGSYDEMQYLWVRNSGCCYTAANVSDDCFSYLCRKSGEINLEN